MGMLNNLSILEFQKGFIDEFKSIIDEKLLKLVLISRRSSKRAGTRYNARGI